MSFFCDPSIANCRSLTAFGVQKCDLLCVLCIENCVQCCEKCVVWNGNLSLKQNMCLEFSRIGLAVGTHVSGCAHCV